MTTISRIRTVGNPKGVILPKKFLDVCGIEGRVNISIKDNTITIMARKKQQEKMVRFQTGREEGKNCSGA